MSMTTEALTPSVEPTGTDILGKVVEAIDAVQDAEQIVVAEGRRLVAHMDDPAAHGAGVAANIEAAMPLPAWEGTSLSFKKADGTVVVPAVNLKGDKIRGIKAIPELRVPRATRGIQGQRDRRDSRVTRAMPVPPDRRGLKARRDPRRRCPMP